VGADETPDLAWRLSWPGRAAFGLKWAANVLRAARGKWQP